MTELILVSQLILHFVLWASGTLKLKPEVCMIQGHIQENGDLDADKAFLLLSL